MHRTFFVFLTLFFMALLGQPVNGRANNNIQAVDFGTMVRSDVAEVQAVVDPLTVQLTDGRLIRLSGIEIPDFGVENYGPYASLSVDILQDLLVGKTIYMHQTAKSDFGRVNRMGHALAQIEVQDSKIWAQGMLLSLGLARVRTRIETPDMASAMYALEDAARAEGSGMWGDAGSRIITPDEAGAFIKSVQIVEGRVVSAAMVKNRIYLNFGADWRTDFTVSIESADKRRFSKAELDPLQWGGKILRVRGWIDFYNGPTIKLDHPEAVIIIDED